MVELWEKVWRLDIVLGPFEGDTFLIFGMFGDFWTGDLFGMAPFVSREPRSSGTKAL
jgi:hypothetical protein